MVQESLATDDRKQSASSATLGQSLTAMAGFSDPYPQRTHILRLLGPKTLLFQGFWAILMLSVIVRARMHSD